MGESERWVHVPPSGILVEDAERLVVHLTTRRGTSRVWRSRPNRTGAEALILQTIEDARAAHASRLVWHTGDAVSPPFMDDLLPRYGFEKTEDLDVLAFDLGADPEPALPSLRAPTGVFTRLVTDEADLRSANAVEAAVFPATNRDEGDTRAYLRGLSKLEGRAERGGPGPDEASLVLRYVASVEDTGGEAQRIVATAGAEATGGTLRLWGAATLAEHRGRGAYRALVLERCRHAHALGATLALTKANTASSAPILRAAGFRTVAGERRYALNLTAPVYPRTRRSGHHPGPM